MRKLEKEPLAKRRKKRPPYRGILGWVWSAAQIGGSLAVADTNDLVDLDEGTKAGGTEGNPAEERTLRV